MFSCNTPSDSRTESKPDLSQGQWIFSFHSTKDGQAIPVRAYIQEDKIIFKNGTETIETVLSTDRDSSFIRMPVFGTYFYIDSLSSQAFFGRWVNPYKIPIYSIPFSAVYNGTPQAPASDDTDTLIYKVTFEPNTDQSYPAVGIFRRSNKSLTGTFLTETGDYRFLEGQSDSSFNWLSCFDGAHLFYFEFSSFGEDSIKGNFYSGKHYSEEWVGLPNPKATLTHPDSLTSIVGDTNSWSIDVLNEQLSEVTINSDSLIGQVSLIQIIGTWCPNCMDETLYFQEVHNLYSRQGLKIIPVAFERGEDSLRWQKAVLQYKKSLDLDYDFYIGGRASKPIAGEVFPMLSQISSFPTTLFIDRLGTIRKVHTGFYGPGTGSYYESYKEETNRFIEQLLRE